MSDASKPEERTDNPAGRIVHLADPIQDADEADRMQTWVGQDEDDALTVCPDQRTRASVVNRQFASKR